MQQILTQQILTQQSRYLAFRHSRRTSPFAVLFAVALLASLVVAGAAGAQDPVQLTGRLLEEWGDPGPHSLDDGARRVLLAVSDTESYVLDLSRAEPAPIHRWFGEEVSVRVRAFPGKESGEGQPSLAVESLRVLPEAKVMGKAVTGSQPWVSILCKFQDIADEPEPRSFFQDMYGSDPGELDHYWREVSDDIINLTGSTADDWRTLPSNQTSYLPGSPGSGVMTSEQLDALFDDCTAAADPFVDFSGNVGINMIFNDVLDCCAWGGGRYATLDGETKLWRVTWMPTWAWDDLAVFGHEMGHGFGLPHSNNWDGDASPYDSPWDVLSAATSYSPFDARYGYLGKHTITYHKDLLGWIDAAQILEISPGENVGFTLDRTAANATTNRRMAKVLIDGTPVYWAVETRRKTGTFESALPADAVLIFQVDESRVEPAWLFDETTPPADFSDNPGSNWTVGETFTDDLNGITITVDSTTADGFVVLVDNASETTDLIFEDDFESGDTVEWDATQQ